MPTSATPPTDLPSDVVLTGRVVDLTPLSPDDVPALKAIAFANPDEYRLTSTPTSDEEAEAYFGAVLAARAAGTAHPVTVRDKAGEVLGVSRLSQFDRGHKRCELGFTWYHPRVFRTAVNTESKLLLLQFAFEALQVNRVQIQTDTRNLRSQRAITALGAAFEGVLKRHMVAKDGHVRDTMVFAITDVTWPTVRLGLEARLASKLEAVAQPAG